MVMLREEDQLHKSKESESPRQSKRTKKNSLFIGKSNKETSGKKKIIGRIRARATKSSGAQEEKDEILPFAFSAESISQKPRTKRKAKSITADTDLSEIRLDIRPLSPSLTHGMEDRYLPKKSPRFKDAAKHKAKKLFKKLPRETSMSVINDPIFSPQDLLIDRAKRNLVNKDIKMALKKLENLIEQFQQMKEDDNLTFATALSFACAHYYLGECHNQNKDFSTAEKHARECLSILDDCILEKEFDLSVSPFPTPIWMHPNGIPIDTLWLRKSETEDMLANLLREQSQSSIAVEWLQRSLVSREKAHLSLKITTIQQLCQIVVEYITLNMDKARIMVDGEDKSQAIKLISDLNFMDKLEYCCDYLASATKIFKGQHQKLVDIASTLLTVLISMKTLCSLENDLGVKSNNDSSSYSKQLENRIERVRKDIRKYKRRRSNEEIPSTHKRVSRSKTPDISSFKSPRK